jgi:mono/diheme cytochrome c family protein
MGDNNHIVNNAHQNNKNGKRLFIFAMVFVLVFFVYVTFFHQHSSPDWVNNLPKQEEAAPAASAPAPQAAAEAKDPWVSTPELVARGEVVYKTNCALCHGEKGMGDGPAGAALNPKPRNYTLGKWKQGNSIIALFNTVTHGIPGSSMAAYESVLPEADRWAVVNYVRKLGKNIVDPTEAEIKAYKAKKK